MLSFLCGLDFLDIFPDEELSGVDDGIFAGDEEELNELSEAGMLEDTEHIPSEEIERSLAMREEFLALNALDEVPEGYQVHHIIPLSEGCEDTPENMVLLTEEEHAAITAAHRDFYDWNK